MHVVTDENGALPPLNFRPLPAPPPHDPRPLQQLRPSKANSFQTSTAPRAMPETTFQLAGFISNAFVAYDNAAPTALT